MRPTVRGYRPTDLDAVYDICVRTADGGGGLVGRLSDDRLIGDIFAAPYVTREPQHAHLLDDGTGAVVGYVLGTADTPSFVQWYADEWIPAVGRPGPVDAPETDREWLHLHHHPERMIVPELSDYPAHLHIDLLPGWQGKGWGRALMTAFLAGLAAAGARRVHLGMLSSNVGARSFYDRLGFHDIHVADAGPVTYLGRETGYSPRR